MGPVFIVVGRDGQKAHGRERGKERAMATERGLAGAIL